MATSAATLPTPARAEHRLRRDVGLVGLLFASVGSIIGSGWLFGALSSDPGFMDGLNVAAGRLTYEPVARDQGLEYTPAEDALAAVPAA